MKESILKLWKLIEKSNKILLINHVRMDMDAFWSLSAIYDILKQLWKDVKAVNDEAPLEDFSFIWYNEIIETEFNINTFSPELIISFDAASLGQLWKYYSENIEVFNNTGFVVIDHHKTNPWFWKINIINTEYSSSCELTYDILTIIWLDKYITPKIATALISWIITDTNIYYNSNTTSNTHYVSWKLLELWADFRKPNFELYKKKTFSTSKLWWEVLANKMQISDDWKVVWALVSKADFEKTNTSERQLTWLISEFFANIEWVQICFISNEVPGYQVKTSFRSTPNCDVSKIAQVFWWGWHKQASGFTTNKSLREIEIDILKEIKKELN